MKQPLTSSRMVCFLSCQRRHYWRYEVGLRHESEAIHFRIGSAWHRAMEARWRGGNYEYALSWALKQNTDLDELQSATLAALLAGYYSRYGCDDWVECIHSEIEFRHSIDGSRSFDAAGKLDGLALLRDGRHAIIEHKTCGEDISESSDYWLRLRFNTQLMQYVIAARERGWQVEVVVYDVVRKPEIAPKQIAVTDDQGRKVVTDATGQRVLKANSQPRETGDKEKGYTLQTRIETVDEFSARLAEDTKARPEFYFARREVPILDQDLQEFAAQRLILGRSILDCRNEQARMPKPEQAWARNVNMFSCRGCEYSSFCLQNLSVNPAQPPAGFKITAAHSELEQPQ